MKLRRFCGYFMSWCCVMVFVTPKMNNVRVEHNGYTGLTVVIADKVKENTDIISKLKTAFTEASKILYKSSKYFVYFKDITIVVPKSWSNIGQYKSVSGSLTKDGDFLIESSNNSNPHVFGQTECGGSGVYAHITPEVVLSSRSLGYGSLEKILIHEWGHLRWGLFDEYSTTETLGDSSPERFYNEEGTWKPIMCTDTILGKNLRDCSNSRSLCFADPDTGKPDEECTFCVQSPNSARASLMAYQWIESVVEFCDIEDDNVDTALRHNPRAPSDQNRLCSQKSAWEVMREHQDFEGNTAGLPTLDTTPTFTLVQEGDPRLVLLLDVSGSMKKSVMGSTRLQLLVDVVSHFLLYTVSADTEIGIVSFSGTANVEKAMTKTTSQTARQELVQSIPQAAGGATSIGAGLLKSLETLNSTSFNLKGNTIILVTDGQENKRPFIKDVMPNVTASGVFVHTLGIGSTSDLQISSIASSTGGKSSYYSESASSTALQDFFADSMSDSSSVIHLDSKAFMTPGGTSTTGEFFIDSSVGLNTIVQLVVNDTSSVNILVTGPDGQVYSSSPNSNSKSMYRAVVIQGTAKVGKYVYSITSTSDIQGTVSVQTTPKEADEEGLRVQSWTSIGEFTYAASTTAKIFASVQQNKLPVLDAQVKASLENENGNVVNIVLRDNGVGSDLQKNDAVYSAYIMPKHVSQGGRLNIKMLVENTNGNAKQVTVTSSGSAPQNGKGKIVTSTQSLDNFQRVSQTGEMIVNNYTSNPLPDQLAPSKITTLELESVNVKIGTFRVKWTAVGDDLDDGTATEYDVRLSSNFTRLQKDVDQAIKLSTNIPTPKSSGETEFYTLTIPDGNQKTFYLAIRAKDDNQNMGDVSNILSLSKITDTVWDTTTSTTTSTTTHPPSTSQVYQRGDNPQSTESVISLTVAIVAVIFILFLIVTAVFFCKINDKQKRIDKPGLLHFHNEKKWRSRQIYLPGIKDNSNQYSNKRYINERKDKGRKKPNKQGLGKSGNLNMEKGRFSSPRDVKITMMPPHFYGQRFYDNPYMYKY